MSWTHVFPILTDEMITAYKQCVTKAEKAQYEAWFGIDRIINPQQTKHTVCFSLFWKNIHSEDPELPVPNRDILRHAQARGIVKRFAPWEHYIQPLLEGAKKVKKARKDTSFRIYLAADLVFLINDFTRLGCEVRLMKSSSLRHNPGAMWRYLALDEKSTLLTFSDADRAPRVLADLDRTDTMARSGLGLWRVPWFAEKPISAKKGEENHIPYRPILGCQFGSASPLPARLLMEAICWNTARGYITKMCQPPGCGPRQVYGADWPDYGFDEWFLQTAVYPRIAQGGVLSFLPADAGSPLLAVDIEYVTWANPRSEIVYFGKAGASCCGPAPEATLPQGMIKISSCPVIHSRHLLQQYPLPPHVQRNIRVTGQQDGAPTGKVLYHFNPGIAKWRGKQWMVYRSECLPMCHYSRVNLIELDERYQPRPGTNRLLTLPTEFDDWGAEDPRLFVFKNELLLTYTNGWKMGIARISPTGAVIEARLFPVIAGSGPADPLARPTGRERDIIPSYREKNWCLFAVADKLYVSYWARPHVVYELNPRTLKMGRPTVSEWQPGARFGELHNSSNGVASGGFIWQVVHFHQRIAGGGNRYEAWMRAFEPKAPFATVLLSRQPLLVGEPCDPKLAHATDLRVVFASGLQRESDSWRICFGQNDRRIRRAKISDAQLQKIMIPVPAMAKPKRQAAAKV